MGKVEVKERERARGSNVVKVIKVGQGKSPQEYARIRS